MVTAISFKAAREFMQNLYRVGARKHSIPPRPGPGFMQNLYRVRAIKIMAMILAEKRGTVWQGVIAGII